MKLQQMKDILLIVILIVSVFQLSAQDSILKVNGEKVSAKVMEIGTDNIKFKKFTNLDGPLYTVSKSEIQEITFENGDKESFSNSAAELQSASIGDSRTLVFVKTTADSDKHPTQERWKEEIERCSQLKKATTLEESELIFEFRIKRALGEARVRATVYNTSDNKKLWESKKYRGTANLYNRMGVSLHGIRKCMTKGIIPELEKGTF